MLVQRREKGQRREALFCAHVPPFPDKTITMCLTDFRRRDIGVSGASMSELEAFGLSLSSGERTVMSLNEQRKLELE
jgi:uncharacterized membrane protein